MRSGNAAAARYPHLARIKRCEVQSAQEPGQKLGVVASFPNSTMAATEGSEIVPGSLSMQRTDLWQTTVTTVGSSGGPLDLVGEPLPVPAGACVRPGRGRYADGAGVHKLAAMPETMRSMVDRALETHIRNTVRPGSKFSFGTVTAELTEVWVSTVGSDMEEKRAACSPFVHADIHGVVALGAALTIGLEDPRQTARLSNAFGSADSSLLVGKGSAVVCPAWLSTHVHSLEAADSHVPALHIPVIYIRYIHRYLHANYTYKYRIYIMRSR